VQQSSQASEWGSRLKTASLGAGFLLWVAINCELLHSHATALLAGVQQKTETGLTPPSFPPRGKSAGPHHRTL